MPAWGEVDNEIAKLTAEGCPSPLDTVRRQYIEALSKNTGRNVIVYYSNWVSSPNVTPLSMINDDDKSGFMQAVYKLDKKLGLDLILHTPGGSVAAAESIVDYLQKIFNKDIRVVVPQMAMSAGTMIACSAKEILMGKQSNLGPIDPQVNGLPAYDVLEEFDKAVKQSRSDNGAALMWQTIVSKYHPTFLSQCEQAIALSKEIVKKWLIDGMFAKDSKAITKANRVVKGLSDRKINKEHSRHLHFERCAELGLKLKKLEDDPVLQDLVLTVHHACMHTMVKGNVVKLIENHNGAAYLRF